MASDLVVTRVTVDYVVNGQPLTIEFLKPETIDSIVLSKADFDRAQAKQNELASQPNSGVPAVTNEFLDLTHPGSAAPDIEIREGSLSDGPVNAVASRSLWWHSGICVWTHPKPF